MSDPIFVDGIPAKITLHDFRRHHLQSFPALADKEHDPLILDAIDSVYTMFPKVHNFWDWHTEQVWYDKTTLCYRLLTAWYIADLYPSLVSGSLVMGGIPVKQRKVDAVSITFPDSSLNSEKDMLVSLKSNPWGNKAYAMIKAVAKRALLRNKPMV